MDNKKVILIATATFLAGFLTCYFITKKEKKSSADGDGEFKAGKYEKAW